MNPEEGELRPQLADRIGLRVEVEPVVDVRRRAEIMRRREAFTEDPGGVPGGLRGRAGRWRSGSRARARIARRRRVPEPLYGAIARVVAGRAASHRADVTVLQCAKALAALAGRETSSRATSSTAGGLALGHRLQLDPFAPATELTRRILRRVLEDVSPVGVDEKKGRARRGRARAPLDLIEGTPSIAEVEGERGVSSTPRRGGSVERARSDGERARSSRCAGESTRATGSAGGGRDLALDATIRAAALRGAGTTFKSSPRTCAARSASIGSPFAVCFVVDNSYSVQAERMVEKVKGVAAAARGRRGPR